MSTQLQATGRMEPVRGEAELSTNSDLYSLGPSHVVAQTHLLLDSISYQLSRASQLSFLFLSPTGELCSQLWWKVGKLAL